MIGPYYVNSEARRIAAWGQPCSIPWATVDLAGRGFRVHAATASAWELFEKIRVEHAYTPTGSDTGFYNCRHMRHDPALPWSAHAWATALDLNWLQNPAGSKLVSDIPGSMIRAVQSARTKSGAWVWMWGGDWDRDPRTGHTYYDAMHFEVIAHPKDLATGFETVGRPGGVNVGLNQGERSAAVKALQGHLNAWQPAFALVEDGIYGTATAKAVVEYQMAAGLDDTGNADDTTLIHLYTNAFRNRKTLTRILEEVS